MSNLQILTVEYDRDDQPVYAFIESANGEIIKDVRRKSDLTKAQRKFPHLVYAGRWDGETSGVLQGYHSCTTGGDVCKFATEPNIVWDDDSGRYIVEVENAD